MREVQVYSDEGCTNQLAVAYIGESGHDDDHDGILAFDNDDDTHFRPDDRHPYAAHTIWLTFSTVDEIKCVYADNLGEGTGGGQAWNGGIKLEVQNENSEWELMFESTSGNTAYAQSIHSQCTSLIEKIRFHTQSNLKRFIHHL